MGSCNKNKKQKNFKNIIQFFLNSNLSAVASKRKKIYLQKQSSKLLNHLCLQKQKKFIEILKSNKPNLSAVAG